MALEAGAEDLQTEGHTFAVYTSLEDFEAVREGLDLAGISIESAALTMIPQTEVQLASKQAEQMLKLMDALDELEDVANMYANFDIDEAQMETLTKA